MVTLSSILVAVPLGVAGGLLLGILAYRYRWVDRTLEPVLDLMQTMPVFAYLVPILILFGFGPTAAVVATLIYHAADDAHHHAGAAPGGARDPRPRPHGGLHAGGR